MTKQHESSWREITVNQALSSLPNSAMPHRLHKNMLEELVRINKSKDHGVETICLALEVIYHGGNELEINYDRTDCVISVYMSKVMDALEAISSGGIPKAVTCEEIVQEGYDFYETVITDLFPCADTVSKEH